ncbi:MAG TPA: nucleotidyltransferase family protein [Thermoanaerobaculia bacterium]|jgi:hypothetical protein|nr:nucleotidyltransferase family protein [Thermoanaerobaculia bacterium]
MIRVQRNAGTFLPTLEQHHLLCAALLRDPAQVREAFALWKSRVHVDDVDHGSFRLLPLLYRNLMRHGIDDPLLPRLKGVYRQVWFRNQLVLDHGVRSLRALQDAHIPAIVLKGAALAGTAYAEPALRPMEDFDVLVARADFARAAEVLRGNGWSFHPPLSDPDAHFVFQHAVGMRREGGGDLDLHWSASGLPLDGQSAQTMWDSSRELRIGDGETRMLGAADQLLQICAHATLLNEHIPPIRWAADAFHLIVSHLSQAAQIEWQPLLALARERRLSHVLRLCLEYLRDGLDVAIPEEVLRTLRKQERIGERLALSLRTSGGRLVYVQFVLEWMEHAFVDTRGLLRLFLLPRFLRSYCRVDSTRALLRLVMSRLALNTRRDPA